VTTTDGTVVLNGNVRSWAERQEAERAAWAAPGVSQVDDRITVVP
jgi:osmotically-inducible protein OsmY